MAGGWWLWLVVVFFDLLEIEFTSTDQAVTSSNLTIPFYLIKIKHMILWVCASFKPKRLSLEEVC